MPRYIVDDKRTAAEKRSTWGFVVATDKFMSGWGHAKGRSLFAVAVEDHNVAECVLRRFRQRSEMRGARIQGGLPRLRDGDHLSIRGRKEASYFFEGCETPETRRRQERRSNQRETERVELMRRRMRGGR